MRLFLPLFFIGLFAHLPSIFGQAKKDTLFFNNGSVIIGKVKKINLGVITFDPDDANDITVQLYKLKTMHTASRYYRLETVDHDVYYAYLYRSEQPGYVKLVGPLDTPLIWIENISRLLPIGDSFFTKMTGSASAGYSYTRSSDLGRFNFDGTVRYISKKYEIALTTSTIATVTDSSYSRDRESVTLQPNYYFRPTWYVAALGNYQRNLELGILRRFQEGGGMGNKFLLKKQLQALGMMGIVLNQEKSTEVDGEKLLVEVLGNVQFNFFRFTKPKIDLAMTQTIFVSLSQKGRIRNDGQTTLTWEFITNLKLNVSIYNNYDSQPPVANNRKFDYGYVFGFGYIFN